MVIRWTRPFRLVLRALFSRAVYTYRFFRRLPGRMLRLAVAVVRYLLIRPIRWGINRVKMQIHAFLVWRKGEPDQVP